MICFNCGLKLHNAGDKDCRLCGAKFGSCCISCMSPNPTMARYCFNCGHKLVNDDTVSTVQNFDTLSESRKNVAVIFADVSGFTALSEKLDPEVVRDIINDCFSCITRPVYELEGTIDKYIGDCVMILFGAKYIHSDDARRAVVCAIEMMELIKEFTEERLASYGIEVTISIGINYGLVITGSVGNYFDKDYTVMGDIVNTAQRLQSNAGRGTILVSESVYSETKDTVSYSDVMEINVKNKENPVRCYYPIKLRKEHLTQNNIPFIGRQKEIGILNSIYNMAFTSGTSCIKVVGDAGMGKTRIIKEFTNLVGNDVKKIWIDCSSTLQNRVYYVISGILMNIMNIGQGDNADLKQHRLASFIGYILADKGTEEIKRNTDFIGLVMGVNRDNEFQNLLDSMSFENIKRELIKQISIFFLHLCKKYRILIVVDDLQWCDSGSLNVLIEILPLLVKVNSIFIFSSRYEIENFQTCKNVACHSLKIDGLGKEETQNLLAILLGCDRIDRALEEITLGFTGGNPLYIREFASNIKRREKYYIKDKTAFVKGNKKELFPDCIQNLILANLSELEDSTKKFLQTASVIGKEFSISLVNSILEYDTDASNVTNVPLQQNIISLKSVYTSNGVVEKIYSFNQDVEREVIYESILNKGKKDLHRKIGELIEAKFTKEIEDYYELLCYHFDKAGLDKKACDYLYKAALKQKNDFNFNSSLEYYNKFLQAVYSKKDYMEYNRSKILNAYCDMGYIVYIMADYDTAGECFDKALDYTVSPDDISSIKIMKASILKEKGLFENALEALNEVNGMIKHENNLYGRLLQLECSILRIMGNAKALSIAKKSEKILLKTKDYHNLAETMRQAGIIYFSKGDIDNALYYLGKSFKYAEKINNLAAMAKISGNMGIVYLDTGMISKAQEWFNVSIDISRKISDQQGYIAGCINLGVLYLDSKGLFDNAEELFGETLVVSGEISSQLYQCASLINLGDLMYERGLYEKALESYSKALEISTNINSPIDVGVIYIGMARVNFKLCFYEDANDMLEAANTIFTDTGEKIYMSDYYRYKGVYELIKNDTSKALEFCEKAVEIAEECRSGRRKLKALRLKGSILACSKEYSKAVLFFNESIELAGKIESDYETSKGFYRRYQAFSSLGMIEDAKKDLMTAKNHISKINQCRWKQLIESEAF